jgi:N-acetylglucosamine kinase-like BadF-type ATPase
VFASNDVVPLVLAPPVSGDGLALVAGTGSTCIGVSPGGAAARVGGHEYLLSDEGSGYQIGLAALRAAMRGYEGTGPCTALSTAVGADLPALARELVASPDAKTRVAEFAVTALRLWTSGDETAGAIVRAAIDDLVALVGATLRRLERDAGALLVVGSLCARDDRFAALLVDRLLARWPGLQLRFAPDGQEQCLALAAQPAAGEPGGVLQWVELSPVGRAAQ